MRGNDPSRQRVGAGEQNASDALSFECIENLDRVIVMITRDRRDRNLVGRQPERQRAGVMFKQHRDEATDRTEHCMVDHYRDRAIAVRSDIRRVETARQNAVELNRSALPGSAQPIAQRKLQLGPVEGAFAGLDRVRQAAWARGRGKGRFRPIP